MTLPLWFSFLSPYTLGPSLEALDVLQDSTSLEEHFFALMESLLSKAFFYLDFSSPSFLLCVSGGSDSLALLYLMKNWCEKKSYKFSVLMMDHQLFPGSKEELTTIGFCLKQQGIKVFFSSWNDPIRYEKKGLLRRAREWRYEEARKISVLKKIPFVLTAHHREENIETYIMRFNQGASFYGQGSMSSLQSYGGQFFLLRPLLLYSKKILQHFLKKKGIFWLEDPGNHELSYTRNQQRFLRKHFPENENKEFHEVEKDLQQASQYREQQEYRVEQHCFIYKDKNKKSQKIYILLHEDFSHFSEEEGFILLYKLCSFYHYKSPRRQGLKKFWTKICDFFQHPPLKRIYIGSMGHGALFVESWKTFKKKNLFSPPLFPFLDIVLFFVPLLHHKERYLKKTSIEKKSLKIKTCPHKAGLLI